MDRDTLVHLVNEEPEDWQTFEGDGPSGAEVHSAESVRDAVDRLSPRDLNRLQAAGRQLVRQYRLDPVIQDHDSLVVEAVTRTLSGDRCWQKRHELPKHLIEVMGSIASSWRKHAARRAGAEATETRESDVAPEEVEGEVRSPLSKAVGQEPCAERMLTAKAALDAIWRSFADDKTVRGILDGWRIGVSGPQIRLDRDISEKTYRAAVRRLRRWVRKEAGHDR